MIDLNDRYSRARLLSYPCALQKAQSHPTTEDYKSVLRLAFSEWGLPKRIQVDHESVFFDNVSKSPYPTQLHLWLLALGVQLCFARRNRPTDQAITERSHQLWYGQVIEGGAFGRWSELYEALMKRRSKFLNHELPCASLEEKPPLIAFPEANYSGRFYGAEFEKELLDLGRADAYYLEKGRWFRRVSKDSNWVSLGGLVYYVGLGTRKGEQLEIVYEGGAERQLLFKDEAGEVLARKAIKGVSVEDLLGEELEPYVSLPYAFQPRLPFTLAEQGVIRVCETMAT